MKVGVLGAGAWGSALSLLAARGGCAVTVWSYNNEFGDFHGMPIPSDMRLTGNMADLADMDAWLVVTPAAFFRQTIVTARPHYKNQPVLICTKGLESGTNRFMSEILAAELPQCADYGVLSGPQFAGEVAHNVPTGSTLAGTPRTRAMGREILSQMYLEESADVIGAEICGVGKNAVALICGYTSVTAGGENERAMLFTRAWGEVVRVGQTMGAGLDTFLGLCGVGDLFLSATSSTSRNFSAGVAIAHDQPVTGTVEGIFALRGLIRRAADIHVDVPVLRDMCARMNLE
ncbi:MAG: hypothetical protein K2L95_00045 [Alphaproteobacteria bacterium]|nr:hypothetical protein [Alphaproteobacteria bacterium]